MTLGCAEKYPPKLIVEGHPARPWAYEGDAPDVKEPITWHSAADLDRIAGEYVRAQNIDLSAPATTTAPAPATATAPEVVERRGDFSKETRFASVYGSTNFGDAGKGEMYLLHVGFGYHFEDYQSISLDLFGGYVRSGIDDNGGVIGADAVYRNHFYRGADDEWTIFLEGGLGLQQASTNYSGERHFNFRTRFGLGASFEIDEGVRALVGASYQHISDAGMAGGGGGFDGPMLYAGVTFSF
ncbi:MAG: acyloxyacyl hydrolase [Tepidisphaeraceae bacterium]